MHVTQPSHARHASDNLVAYEIQSQATTDETTSLGSKLTTWRALATWQRALGPA